MLHNVLDNIGKLEKIVRNSLNNNELHQIDRDLILEKLRNIYEEVLSCDFQQQEQNITNTSFTLSDSWETDNIPEESVKDNDSPEEEISENTLIKESEKEQTYEQEAEGNDAVPEKENIEKEISEAEQNEEKQENDKSSETETHYLILNENDTEETIVYQAPEEEEETKEHGVKENTLAAEISEEQKHQIADDLFNGDLSRSEALIQVLDDFDDFDNAILYLQEHFSDKSDKQSVALLADALSSKLI